jgi:hypothetical protein
LINWKVSEQEETEMAKFQKGVSGNPGGRPKLPAEMREIFQSRGLEAAEILVKHLRASDPRVSVAAAREILDRAYGKPVQSINVDREERIKFIAVVPAKPATTEEWLKLVEAENPSSPHDVIDGYAREIDALPSPGRDSK